MPGADENRADDADAHAAHTGHVDAPRCLAGGRPSSDTAFRLGQLVQFHVGQRVPTPLFANHRHLLEAGARLYLIAVIVADGDTHTGAVVHAPGQIGVDLSAVIGVDRWSGPGQAVALVHSRQFSHTSGVTFMCVLLGQVSFFLD